MTPKSPFHFSSIFNLLSCKISFRLNSVFIHKRKFTTITFHKKKTSSLSFPNFFITKNLFFLIWNTISISFLLFVLNFSKRLSQGFDWTISLIFLFFSESIHEKKFFRLVKKNKKNLLLTEERKIPFLNLLPKRYFFLKNSEKSFFLICF